MLLTLLTPEKTLFTGEVDSLIVPGTQGLMGILKNHAPIISSLAPGLLQYKTSGKKDSVFVSGGFMEFSHNNAVVLADSAEFPKDIDIERAKRAFERAKKRLEQKDGDLAKAKMALSRSIGRQQAYKKHG